jgi:hypothetical protein
MGLRSPHLLLASSNSHQMLANLRHILDSAAFDAIQSEITLNVRLLFELGESHHAFARQLPMQHWRQRISRLYYGAYNVRRAVNLHENGAFRTDVDDHKKTELPSNLNNASTYSVRLRDLREDRNLSDYDHTAVELDLVLTQNEAELIVTDFITDARTYLVGRGVIL